jgi:hypothetical protein
MKTIVQIANLLFTSAMLFWLHSCEKPKSEPSPISCTNNTMPLPQMAKDYFLFKDGSYWVYKNTITQQQDSFYVTDFKNLTGDNTQYKYGNTLKRCYEMYEYKMKGNLIGGMKCVSYPNFPNNDLQFATQTFFIDEYNNKITGQQYSKFTFIGDSLLRSDFVLGSTINLLDSLGVSGKFYYNIISQRNANLGIDYAKVSYYAKNIGLIKFTTNDNQTYELIKYHINQ